MGDFIFKYCPKCGSNYGKRGGKTCPRCGVDLKTLTLSHTNLLKIGAKVAIIIAIFLNVLLFFPWQGVSKYWLFSEHNPYLIVGLAIIGSVFTGFAVYYLFASFDSVRIEAKAMAIVAQERKKDAKPGQCVWCGREQSLIPFTHGQLKIRKRMLGTDMTNATAMCKYCGMPQ